MDCIHSGVLWKRAPQRNIMLPFQMWKRRYVEFMDSGKLEYYSDESRSTLKGAYELDGETQCGEHSEMEGHEHCLRIVTKSREIFLSCESEEARTEWIGKIVEWCKRNKQMDRITAVMSRATLARENSPTPVMNPTAWDQARRDMYSYRGVPEEFIAERNRAESAGPDLHFSDHAFGAVPPLALYRAHLRNFGYHTGLVNGLWAALWGEDIPAACGRVKKMLGFSEHSEDVYVEVAHNIHQFIGNLFSSRFDRVVQEHCTVPFRVLTSDVEFYSVTRQLNRFLDSKSPRFAVDCIPARPVETFTERVLEHLKTHEKVKYDFLYFSHVSFIQLTLIPKLKPFVASCRELLERNKNEDAIIVIDGYHSFGAFEVNLVDCDCIFIFGVLKHMGCGTNLAFACVPSKYCSLRPLITGWLADFSVLSPTHTGIKLGSPVDYQPGVVMMGSTVAFGNAILTFNNVYDAWKERGITPERAHEHVMHLHRLLLEGLDDLENRNLTNPFICRKRLMILQPEDHRSHTLVFVQENPTCAMLTVNYFATHRITLDSRNTYVRFGIGLNHNPEDIERVLNVLSCWKVDASVDIPRDNMMTKKRNSLTYN